MSVRLLVVSEYRSLTLYDLMSTHSISLTATLSTMTPHQRVFTLVLTVIALALSSTATILTVKPSSTTPCDNDPCITLSEYVQNHTEYFNSSNITLQFLPGNHTLVSNLTIANIQYLDILGNGTSLTPSRVECSGSNVGIEFRNISEVTVADMTFTSCGRLHTINVNIGGMMSARSAYHAVQFESIQRIEVTECIFHDSSGTALGILNSSAVFSGNNMFSSNCRRCQNGDECIGCFGGGIYVEASDVTFSGSTTFDGNLAYGGGGIFACHYSDVSFNGGTTFKGNSARLDGGGIFACHYSYVNFSGNTIFTNNSAIDYGGGICVRDYSSVNFSGNTRFNENSAIESGGGIFAYDNSDASFSGNTTFNENSAVRYGGGIYAWGNSNVSFSGITTFMENSAEYGGGIYAWTNSNVSFSGITTFMENSAVYGGGIRTRDNSNVRFSGNTRFRENTAVRDGGGIFAHDNSDASFSGNTTFIENSAQYGGGIGTRHNSNVRFSGNTRFRENTAVRDGGGIFAYYNSDASFSGNTTFNENSAVRYGGGIHAWTNSDASFSGITTFMKNSAVYGGGIRTRHNSNVRFRGNTRFNENTAVRDGGGIRARDNSHVSFSGNGTISDNIAEDGGGIMSRNCNIDLSGNITVRNNTAQLHGAGIYIRMTNLTLAGIKFTDNSAREGGGIYAATNSNLDFDGMNTFDSNRADISGGGIWVDNAHLVLNGSNSIVMCTAGYEGGGISMLYATIDLPGNNKFISNSATSGGGISARWSTLSFTNSSHFSNNSAADKGGGISTSISAVVFGGYNSFDNNCADLGGGIQMLNSSIKFLGNNHFNLNHARRDGGGVHGDNCTVNLSGSGTSSFRDNKAERGGGMFIESCNFTAWRKNCSTNCDSKYISERNVAKDSGGGIYLIKSRLCMLGNSFFHGNKGMTGGGIYSINSVLKFSGNYSNFFANSAINTGGGFAAVCSTLDLVGNTTFERNSALTGGAMYMEDTQINLNGTNHFIEDHAHHEGGAIYIRAGKMNISGKNILESNSAATSGGSLFATCATINFTGITIIHNSKSPEGAAIHVVSSSVILEGTTQFQNNFAHYGGAVLSKNSNFTFGKSTCARKKWDVEFCYHSGMFPRIEPEPGSSFINNTALLGGAMHLDQQSSIYIHPLTCMLFKNNKATEYGGAIYVIDNAGPNTLSKVFGLSSRTQCFAHVISNAISQSGRINLTFDGNTAEKSGSVLYGGMLNKCNDSYLEENTLHLFNSSIKDGTNDNKVAAISSDPVLCFCSEGGPHEHQCDKIKSINAFPGQKVIVSVIGVDQTNTPIQTAISTNLISDEKDKSCVCEAFSQEKEGFCRNRSYTIKSPITTSELFLYPTVVSGSPTAAVLNITFQYCPIGFEYSNLTNECICDHRLQMFTNTCNIDSQTLLRTVHMNFWVNAFYDNETFEGYITHPQCPLNYCSKERKDINLYNPDEQCNSNRSGLLCGSCEKGFSFILGSSQCKKCNNKYLALLIPFALAGVALVILLFVLNLTVTTGTLHGLIFYANIVAANYQIFFPPNINILAGIFIAWLNLDLGIETCFYHGMDAYSKLWLQFVFPLYIWGIVGFLIYISRHSRRLTHLLGSNPVAVLDTLFLLSYTKLLRTIITTLSLTTLQYPNDESSIVWLYDPSVSIPKLVPFFLVALVFVVFLLLPYTLLLLVGQWLWTETNCCLLASLNKHPRLKLRLKTILDPYHAPYKSECRYWTGLFLLFRCILFLVSAFNVSGDKNSANLLSILIVVIGSFVVFGLAGRVYIRWCLNALELSFLLNLGIFTAGTYHVSLIKGDQAVIAHISVGIAFFTFVGIVAYHAYLRMKPWITQHTFCCIKVKDGKSCYKNKTGESDTAQANQLQTHTLASPTVTVVDLGELRSPKDLSSECNFMKATY